MRGPRTKLHRPATALARLQDLIGQAAGVAMNDRNEHRAAQLASILREAFEVALAARCGGPLPSPRNHKEAV
jgi:hypothetical protein